MESLPLGLQAFFSYLNDEKYLLISGIIFCCIFVVWVYVLLKSKKNLQKTIYKNMKSFQKSFDTSDSGILILSHKDEVIYANKSMMIMCGLERRSQHKIWNSSPQIRIKDRWETLDSLIAKHKKRKEFTPWVFPQTTLKVLDQESLSVDVYFDKLLIGTERNKYYHILTIQDLTESHEVSELAHRHKLTHLPNQLQAEEDIPSLFSKIHLQKKKIAFVLMGFDNYARLRSILGYEESNHVIIQFASYLKGIVTPMNISVYHTFDNHFLLIVTEVASKEGMIGLLREIQLKVASLYKHENLSLHLTFSAGIAIYPDNGGTKTLLDNTYHALAEAQSYGDGKIHLYAPTKTKNTYTDLILHNDMEDALINGEFEVYYQPIVEVKNEEIVAAEALIRWIHPTFGMIPPDHFIGLMEKTGFIVKLGQFILESVLQQQKRWEMFEFKQIEVSINVSMVEIATGEYVQNVQKQLLKHEVQPKHIKFEITEGMAMIGESQTEKYFTDLKALGVKISLDDFGTGYTSFFLSQKVSC
ncbi:MAG: EAL domain-containing protein [Sulfurovum sp.]|nr:EAL domain-containing protein [Sulfurovum sp.]